MLIVIQQSPTPLALPFAQVRAEVEGHRWRPELTVREIPAPGRIARDSMAIEATVIHLGRELGSGRLILLHEPAGNESWEGDYRLVTMARAAVDAQIAVDPLLGEVAWSWLIDALEEHDAVHRAPAGTTTSVLSRPFGQLEDDPDENHVELRASWTPVIDDPSDIVPHLEAWQDLLCRTCGMDPMPEGVVQIAPRRAL